MIEGNRVAMVYGKPECQQCKATTRLMDKESIPYNYADITVNEIANQEVKRLGYTSLPVVVTDSGQWAGFIPDRIRGLKP